MFSKVLLATDLSKGSAEVARCVHGLKPLGTKEIILAECLKTLEAFSMAYSEDVEKFKASLIEQENIVKEQEFSVKSETVFGSVHTEIDRLIKKYDCNAVMVPSLGHTMLSDILLGNLASELINHITKPLLLVRLKVVDTNNEDKKTCILASSCENFIASILYATDFSEHADEAFLYLRKLVKSGAEEVTLLHVQDMVKLANESKENIKRFDAIDHGRLSKLRDRLLSINPALKINLKIIHGKPKSEILKFANKIDPSLIVLGTQGRGYVGDIFLGSISYTIARNSLTSVLLIPKNRRE